MTRYSEEFMAGKLVNTAGISTVVGSGTGDRMGIGSFDCRLKGK